MTTSLSLDKAKVFNPYKHFALGGNHDVISIPMCLSRYKGLSDRAKSCWARLAMYCGENGICNPSYKTLGEEIAVERRQAVNLVNELINKGFLRRAKESGSRTTHFLFLWHPVFETEKPAASSPKWARDCPDRSGSGQSFAHEFAPDGAISCPEVKVGNRPVPKMSEPAQVTGFSGSDSDHEPNCRQPNAHKLRIKNKEEKTTTTCRGCAPSQERANPKIPPEVEHYIELNTEWTKAHGQIKTDEKRYRRALWRFAAQGKLDMSDWAELEAWAKEREAALAAAKRESERAQERIQDETQNLLQKQNQDRARYREAILQLEQEGVRPEDWFQGHQLDKSLVKRVTGWNFETPDLWKTLQCLYPSHCDRSMELVRAVKPRYRGIAA